MKMVMVAYNEAMDTEVMEALEQCCLTNYTKLTGVQGKGSSSGTHHGTEIWPGLNNLLYVAAPDECAKELLRCVGKLRSSLKEEGIKAFMWTLDSVT